MAEAWGTPPWEIMAHPGSLKWAARFALYRQEVADARDDPPPTRR